MSNGNVESPGATRASGLDPDAVGEWLARQRWYATKSRQIATLEAETGATLVRRVPSGAMLTDAGRLLVTRANAIFQLSPLAMTVVAVVGATTAIFAASTHTSCASRSAPGTKRRIYSGV